MNDKLQDQDKKTKEYTKLKEKAEINYKYLDVKSHCYKDYEREYVHANAKKIKADGKDYGLSRINAREKELIFKQIPEEFKSRAKDILDPPKRAKTITKSHDFIQR